MRLTRKEAQRRAHAAKLAAAIQKRAITAFSDEMMLEHAGLVVFTRGQWNGIRAAVKRMRMA